jgi:hypothetical protein
MKNRLPAYDYDTQHIAPEADFDLQILSLKRNP